MIQFAVTVFIRLQAAAYNVFFYHFVRPITEGVLQWGSGYISYFFILSKCTDDVHLSLCKFFRQTLFSHSIHFNITCTSVTGGIMFNRRQL